jgi:hypothetical protein
MAKSLRFIVLLGLSCLGPLFSAQVFAQASSYSVHLPSGYDFSTSIE